jgi:hypothetical protein
MKSELRRKQREEHAAMMSRNLESHDGELLENLAPVLDDSVGDLKAAERDAIFLRYFQRKSYHEISLALGTTEEAARKRVERAVDKMREFFKKRGFTVSGAGLAGSIESQFAQSAPQALTAAVLQTVMSAPACTLTQATLNMITTVQLKTAIIGGVATALAIAALVQDRVGTAALER